MPRKGHYGVDYDDEYGMYGDYDYEDEEDYEYDAKEYGATTNTKAAQGATKAGVWRCPICTFDNEDSLSACDICGVLRNPLVKDSNGVNNSKVGIYPSSGPMSVSILQVC